MPAGSEVKINLTEYQLIKSINYFVVTGRVERSCNKDFTHRGIHIKEGTIVSVPTYALHYDEEYYPDPYKFNPDR